MSIPGSQGPSRLEQSLEAWKSRLLDFSRRNRLLYFRGAATSSLHIVQPALAEVFRSLVTSRQVRPIYEPVGSETRGECVSATVPPKRPLAHDLVVDSQDSDQLRRTLTNLYRKSRTDYEERGVRILHVAFGLLQWREHLQGSEERAPLLLLPVELCRETAKNRYVVRSCDEDLVLNPCLEAKLRRDFAVDLRQIPEDLEDLDPATYLAELDAQVRSYGWRVTSDVWIGLFSFLKLAMYRDLEVNESEVRSHPMTQLLAGMQVSLDCSTLPEERELDDRVKPSDTFTILDADSSQVAAIEAGKAGRSFVLQGPPGTGKSQTIANLIAEFIAAGKRVLFVSEKMAALEVVYKRLDDHNLQQFVLELHSHKANKRAVVEQLKNALLNDERQPGHSFTELEFRRLEGLRAELNQYVTSLHTVRRPLDQTVFQVFGRLAALEHIPAPALHLADEAVLTPELLAHALELSNRLALVWDVAQSGERFPWYGNSTDIYSPVVAEEYRALISEIRSQAMRAKMSMQALAGSLDISHPPSISLGRLLCALREHLRHNPKPRPDWILNPPSGRWGDEPVPAAALASLASWLESAPEPDTEWLPLAQRLVNAVASLGRSFDVERLLMLDIETLHGRFVTKYKSFFRYFSSDYYADLRAINGCVRPGIFPEDFRSHVALALEALELIRRIGTCIDWTLGVREIFVSHGVGLPEKLARQLAVNSPASDEFLGFTTDFNLLLGAWDPFAQRFSDGRPACGDLPAERADIDTLVGRLSELENRIELLSDWVDYKNTTREWSCSPLDLLLRALEQYPPPKQLLPRSVEKALLRAWADQVARKDGPFARFRGDNHKRVVDDFRRLDERLWRTGNLRVVERALPRRPDTRMIYAGSETKILLNESTKKRRHWPIRRLFAAIPSLLQQLKPVMLMSPLSVSHYLASPNLRFDVVLVDEASQICPEDALVALYRAKQVIVAGDNKQLPPTPFFQATQSEEDVEDLEDGVDEHESVLDALFSAGLPPLYLRWHYRSQNEDLIAFSNHKFYENRLITFPHAQTQPDSGVHFVYVPNGVYDRGGKRSNQKEAEVALEVALQHVIAHPKKTVGVVAFSQSQASTIQDVLDRRLISTPELEHKLRADRLEGFFIKSLENVQGDERDIMVFSVGYGRDQVGKLTMNFGPLNKEGGHRRLNVAITRARQKVVLVSSIKAGDVDTRQATPEGVLALRGYLDYAENGVRTLHAGIPMSLGESESPLEEEVAAAIRSMGYEVATQVGCSGYRIDIGVLHPGSTSHFILGVECDGATYHSGATARDRDRLRQQVLERLGWRMFRVWSTDWVSRPATERRRLQAALTEALTASVYQAVPPVDPQPDAPGEQGADSKSGSQLTRERGHTLPPTPPEWQKPYRHYKPELADDEEADEGDETEDVFSDRGRGWVHRPGLVAQLGEIVALEGPIHLELAKKRLVYANGRKKVGRRISAYIDGLVRQGIRERAFVRHGDFLCVDGATINVVRIPSDDPNSRRLPEHICPEEYLVAITEILKSSGSVDMESLISAVARMFGFSRTGSNVHRVVESTIEKAIASGKIMRRDVRLSLQP